VPVPQEGIGRVMRIRNVIAMLLIALSFIILIPGLTLPLITISASVQFMGQTIDLFTQTRSILQSIRSLHESGNDFVAGLILLFSVIVPFVKGVLLLVVLLLRKVWARSELFYFVRSISKWAMADVFVVGVYVAYLAAKATDNLDAQIQAGFYWFVSYCLVSLLALQFMKIEEAGREDAPSEGRRRWTPWWWIGSRARPRIE
jgi:uncharacterized paraquat-inducible protein A